MGAPAENAPSAEHPLLVDRYAIYDAIAAGGMATVHLGRLIGTAGFLRTVAIKRLHSQFAHDPEFTTMLLDEARLASRIQHPNVVSTIDVVMNGGELLLVMEYVRGESLSRLVRRARDRGERLPPRVVMAILSGTLHGLHAAHEAVDEKGAPLGLVHRDVSPQNVLVGSDGIARVLDFGVAKAAGRVHTTRDGDIKGKVLYMAPEQLGAQPLTRTADVYGLGVVLFETLTCVRMFAGENESAALTKIIHNEIRLPSEIHPDLACFDPIVRRATAALPSNRYATALEMAVALEATGVGLASPGEVSDVVQRLAGETLDERARIVAEIERSSTRSKPPLAMPSGTVVQAAAPAVAEPVVSGVIATAQPKRRPIAALSIILLMVLLLAALSAIVVLLARGGTAGPTAATKPADEPGSVGMPAVVRRSEATGAAPSAATTATAPAPVTVTATATATVSAADSATPRKPTAPVRARVNCDPPYVIDKNGHQHFLPECMK